MRLDDVTDVSTHEAWKRLWESDETQHPYYLLEELVAGSTHFHPVYYLPPALQYTHDAAALIERKPHYLIAWDDNGPVMGVALTVDRYREHARISAFGRPLYVVQNRNAVLSRLNTAAKVIYRRIRELSEQHAAYFYHLRDYVRGGTLSPLTDLILLNGGTAHPFYTQEIRLDRSLPVILDGFRRNHRKIITRGRGDFKIERVYGRDAAPYHRDLLERLHCSMRGRMVRPRAYWNAVIASVRAETGFLLFGVDAGDWVSGAYFAISQRSCYYAAAAHDPSSRGAGLSHLMLWEAVKYAKEHGCTYFEVGDRLYPQEHYWVEEKLHAISHFKSGFGQAPSVRMDVLSRYS